MKCVTIVGARPQFIKAAPLSIELRKEHEEFLLHTGQHYDNNMSAIFFRELDIPSPDIHLGICSGSHAEQTASMLCGIENVLQDQNPNLVIVFGDTNSTLSGALAAAKLHIPVAHIEAGLRSFRRDMPEEINRIVTDHVSTWHFAPSKTAVDNLTNEGITKNVYNVGDIMADSVRIYAPKATERSKILNQLGLRPKQYHLATVHRAANTDCRLRLRKILENLRRLPLPVVLPLHPRTREAMNRFGINNNYSRVHTCYPPLPGEIILIEPLGYLDMLQLQKNAAVILTDSGGMQKEAYYLGVPCVTLRDETEWPETIQAGWNRLAGLTDDEILRETTRAGKGKRVILYGDGYSALKILSHLKSFI